MPNQRLQAVLAAFLPLLPLLFPDELDDSETDLWAPVPYAKGPAPQYISASFSVESITKTPAARELNSSLTLEALADVLTESWNDTPPVLQAFETIINSLLSYTCRLNVYSRLLAASVGVPALIVALLAFASTSWVLGRKSNYPQDITDGQAVGEHVAPELVDVVTLGEPSQPSMDLVDGPAPSCPQSTAVLGTTSLDPVAAMVNPCTPASSQSSVVSHTRQVSFSTPLVRVSTPPRPGSPLSSSQAATAQGISSDHPHTVLEVSPATVDNALPTCLVACSSVLFEVPASPLGNWSTSQLAFRLGSSSPIQASEEHNAIPTRSSWSLEKACEKAPFEAKVPGSPVEDGYTTGPSSPRPLPQPQMLSEPQPEPQPQLQPAPEPQPQLQPAPEPQPHAVVQPRFNLPEPPIDLTDEHLRAAPLLITDEVINGVPTDVSERTEEPDSDHPSPSTPRARWYSGIRGRLAIVDDRGLTYGAKKIHPKDGVMSSPETETTANFAVLMPQPLLAVVMPPPLWSACGSRGLGLDVATDGEGPEDSDHSDDAMVRGSAIKSLLSDHGDSDCGSDSSAQRLLRSDSPSSIHTVTVEKEDAQLLEATSALELVQAVVNTQAYAGAEAHEPDAQEVTDVVDYVSSTSDWEVVEAPSRGRSPEPVQLTASVLSVADSQPVLMPSLETSHIPPTSSKGPSTAATSTTRILSRSASRSRRNMSVVVASTGLVGGRPFALTPKGIDYAAEQLAADVAAGERGRRRRRETITAEAKAKHVDRSVPCRQQYREDRRNRLEHVPSKVDRDILDGGRHPPLANDTQVRRGVYEIGRSRTKTLSRATSSVRLEANPASSTRSRSASVASSSSIPRATSEPPVQRVQSEHIAQENTVLRQDRHPLTPARTSYSTIVAQGQCREPRSRTQSEQSVTSISAACSIQDYSTVTSSSSTTGPKTKAPSTQEQTPSGLNSKGRAIDYSVTAGVRPEPAEPASLQHTGGSDDFSSSAPSQALLVRKVSAELKARILSQLSHSRRKLSLAATAQLRDIANSARNQSLLVQSGMVSPDAPVNPESNAIASEPVLPSLGFGREFAAGVSSDSLSGSALGSSAAAMSLAPLRLPASSTETVGDSNFSAPGLPLQQVVTQEQQQDKSFKGVPLLPRRDRLPSTLAQPALSFSALCDPIDETKDLIATSQEDSPCSPSLGSSAIVRLGNSLSSEPHVRQSSVPVLLSIDAPTTSNDFSPSASSQAGFSSDEGEKVVVRPDIPASDSWKLNLNDKADTGMHNRGHQTLPRGLTTRRRASTNSMSIQAQPEATSEQPVPGVTRRRSTRLTGGRFDGMKRHVLIQ